MKYFKILTSLCVGMAMLACSDEQIEQTMRKLVVAPPSKIERDVKGHEQIYSVQAILRMAHKYPGRQENRELQGAYLAFDLGGRATPIPVYQEMEFRKDNNGKMSISSPRKSFDVLKGENLYYGLELRYYDLNGLLINHQFSNYDPEDEPNSTLLVHQHFFTIQGYALGGYPLTYPMSLDSVYYDRYLFARTNNSERMPATMASSSIVYAEQGAPENSVPYSLPLALRASDATLTAKALQPYKDPKGGKTYHLFQTIDPFALNELVPEIFSYEYRDTDPVEEILGHSIVGNDDLGRLRLGKPVIRLRKKRSLEAGAPLDALGFKGILHFKKSNVAFQMRTCISHILTSSGKYDRQTFTNRSGWHEHNDISRAWNSFDIDYPIPFRVLADVDEDRATVVKQIQRFYPDAQSVDIERLLWGDGEYFRRNPRVTM